jgi:hypothetical protein
VLALAIMLVAFIRSYFPSVRYGKVCRTPPDPRAWRCVSALDRAGHRTYNAAVPAALYGLHRKRGMSGFVLALLMIVRGVAPGFTAAVEVWAKQTVSGIQAGIK